MSAIDSTAFKNGMRHLAAGVTMVTTRTDSGPFGLVATAVCSVCADPPTLLVCINRGSAAHDAIAGSGVFCVNVVDQEQAEIVPRFLATGHERRFDFCAWTTLKTGAPVLESALVSFDCEIAQSATAGTHTVFFGRVVAARVAPERAPLLYYNGSFAGLSPLPAS
jgi:flavin reductase (DIM6/NTAB) family NADH-FMN oxidoreductase RutF